MTLAFTRWSRMGGLLVALAIVTTSPAVNGANKRIVLIAGRPSHPPGAHEFRAGCMLLQKALSNVTGLTVDVYTNGWPSKTGDGAAVDDHAALDGADAVLIYSDGGGAHPAIQRDHMKVIDALAAKGVGLGFAHYAVEVPAGAPGEAMQRWNAGYYETNFSVNPMWAPAFDSFPNHPVTRGVKPFSNRDEWYFNMRWRPDMKGITPILVDTPADSVRTNRYVSPAGPYQHIMGAKGRKEIMMWAVENPNGQRGFGFT